MSHPIRIVIVGGGIAGILLATRLGNHYAHSDEARVTLIDSSQTHIWKPMLHTIAAGTRDVSQQQVSYLAHASAHRFAWQPGRMCGLDRARKEVLLDEIRTPEGELVLEPRTIPFDVLVLSVGSQANDFGVPGVRQHCHFIDSQKQAEAFNVVLRNRMLRAVAKDERLRVAIVGAGATGVELSAELSRVLEIAEGYGDPTLRSRLSLTLLESGPRVLASFPPKISASSEEQLRHIGFRVQTSTRVTAAQSNGFQIDGGRLVSADLMVWAAGVKAPDFMNNLAGMETTRSNQIVVKATLQSTSDDNIFALGDCASLTLMDHERPLPPTAQVATQQAEHLARHLPAWLARAPLPDFKFRDYGSLVSLSDYGAFGTLGSFGFFRGGFIRGRFAQMSHAMLYRRLQQALHGFGKAALMWSAEQINSLVQPKIRLS
ncbi:MULTISPECIES: NAD(P)/FAD-dependent oxidoreductase [Paraburkholderia]|uniref:NAD(P)/FAD-dependent oxidoreductase n=1 Tax=Paraburkholderia podalyriae TaxID=1938811 RepID=A0ABR7PZN8_9BURK|nr:NAD(P)/FAD-dependent oxidoreductase [Paraburkholderia podalyriae]MBC8751717.1 NAD(P)/FAD-dependent oxidoreductase [Paraburkholderia podalyriae]